MFFNTAVGSKQVEGVVHHNRYNLAIGVHTYIHTHLESY